MRARRIASHAREGLRRDQQPAPFRHAIVLGGHFDGIGYFVNENLDSVDDIGPLRR